MTSSFSQLILMNLRLVYRNTSGLFFTIVMPSLIYIALSVLPIGATFGGGINYSQYVLPGIIAMTIMQGGIYGLAYWMVDLKARGVIKRFLVTPLKQSELIISVLISRVLIALAQATFLTLIGVIFFHVTITFNIFFVFVLAALGASIFLLIGLLISMFADTYEAAAPITAAVGLPMTFLGNIFFSNEGLPSALKFVSKILPITYLADGIREIFLSQNIPTIVYKDVLVLAVWFIVILLFTLWQFRLKE